jgi:hypothetical protein
VRASLGVYVSYSVRSTIVTWRAIMAQVPPVEIRALVSKIPFKLRHWLHLVRRWRIFDNITVFARKLLLKALNGFQYTFIVWGFTMHCPVNIWLWAVSAIVIWNVLNKLEQHPINPTNCSIIRVYEIIINWKTYKVFTNVCHDHSGVRTKYRKCVL